MLAESDKFEKKTKRGYENEKNQDIFSVDSFLVPDHGHDDPRIREKR